jgi:NADPH2:quinone reductase
MIEAASLPETFFTVWGNVFVRGQLQAGETVLVHGGSRLHMRALLPVDNHYKRIAPTLSCSGIGTTAIQLCKAKGARVIVTVRPHAPASPLPDSCLQVGSDLKKQACIDCGADLVINYKCALPVAPLHPLTRCLLQNA